MHWLSVVAVLFTSVALNSCSESKNTVDAIGVRMVQFPNGTRIRAEAVATEADLQKGLMFRESLAADAGMLFTHPDEGVYPYWMYQTKIPLDIIWMDRDHRIVEVSLATPPCASKIPKDCPSYGGNMPSRYVLEVSAGTVAKNGLQVGNRLDY